MTKSRSSKAKPNAGRKHFTLEEARRALPYVSRIVKDVTACYREVLESRTRLEMPQPADDPQELKRQYELGMDRLNVLVAELQGVGVELKDFERGLIDFPALHDDREICLCWHLGEDTIVAWHELDAGYAGRQDVALLEPVGAAADDARGDEA